MEPKFNLWIEHNGVVVLSEWRVKLLDAIDQTGSISRAAEKMKVTYHRAWEKVHEMEEGLGYKVIDAQVGGAGGGGAELNAQGRDLVKRFRAFDQGLSDEIDARFEEAFK
ncbi:MAG TPA: LysR family transcriptional regulator [Anaerolineae bacterium]|nr:LysR family transcriptional regulator [Anaerolineae bacterium]